MKAKDAPRCEPSRASQGGGHPRERTLITQRRAADDTPSDRPHGGIIAPPRRRRRLPARRRRGTPTRGTPPSACSPATTLPAAEPARAAVVSRGVGARTPRGYASKTTRRNGLPPVPRSARKWRSSVHRRSSVRFGAVRTVAQDFDYRRQAPPWPSLPARGSARRLGASRAHAADPRHAHRSVRGRCASRRRRHGRGLSRS